MTVLLIYSLLTAFSAAASGPEDCSAPAKVVARYLELDSRGETLRTNPKIKDLIDLEGGELPGWDVISITRQAPAAECHREENRAVFDLVFSVVGELTFGGPSGEYPVFTHAQTVKDEPVHLQVMQKSGQWRIDAHSVPRPHLTAESAVAWLRRRLEQPGQSVLVKSKTEEAIRRVQDAQASSGSPAELVLKKIDDTSAFTRRFARGKLVVLGKEWSVREYCTEQIAANPSMLEAFKLNDKVFPFATLCPGVLDGETNVVTVFSPAAAPQKAVVKPFPDASRITDAVLRETIQGLIAR